MIQARVRHTTVIVLPDQEQILDFVAGDADTWAVSGAANVAYIKPGEENARTNIALICASGNIYSFRVYENKNAETDLIVYVDYAALEKDKAQGKRPEPHEPKFISKMDVAIYQEAARSRPSATPGRPGTRPIGACSGPLTSSARATRP